MPIGFVRKCEFVTLTMVHLFSIFDLPNSSLGSVSHDEDQFTNADDTVQVGLCGMRQVGG